MNIELIVIEAKNHKTLSSLSRYFNFNVYMVRYHLAKARKLDLVKEIMGRNRSYEVQKSKV